MAPVGKLRSQQEFKLVDSSQGWATEENTYISTKHFQTLPNFIHQNGYGKHPRGSLPGKGKPINDEELEVDDAIFDEMQHDNQKLMAFANKIMVNKWTYNSKKRIRILRSFGLKSKL